MKLVRSKARLAATPHMGWVHSVPEAQIKLLVLRGALRDRPGGTDGNRNRPFLTRAAAACLAALMGERWRRHEPSGARGGGNRPGCIDDRRGNVPMIVVV